MRRLKIFSMIALVSVSISCAQLGSVGDILGTVLGGGARQQAQIDAQIQRVDANGQRLFVNTREGRSGAVRFDSQTLVVYNQRQYPVTALSPGDIVVMQVQQTTQNELYAARIDVTQPVQQQRGSFLR
jgi:hypothetical protein